MIHSKNQMIRSMKSYEVGGSSSDCNSRDGGCGAKKAARKNNRKAAMRKIGKAIGGAGNAVGTVVGGALLGAAGYGLKKLSEQKKGGAIKKVKKMEMGGMTASTETCGPGRPCHKTNKKANNQRLKAAGVPRKTRRSM